MLNIKHLGDLLRSVCMSSIAPLGTEVSLKCFLLPPDN